MRVFITGATGFVGRALTLRLLGTGHQVTAWVRDENRARNLLGSEVVLVPTNSSIGEHILRANAVINLAGSPCSPVDGRRAASTRLSRAGSTSLAQL